jgi:hypothetical protein
MAAKPPEIPSSALAEFKSALSWYLERNETTADKFVAELDRAIEIAGRDTPTLASRRPWHSEVRPAAIPVCYFLSGETGSRPSAGHRSRAPATRVLEGSALAVS